MRTVIDTRGHCNELPLQRSALDYGTAAMRFGVDSLRQQRADMNGRTPCPIGNTW